MTSEKKNPQERFRFLHTHIAKEPFIYDVLDEIASMQLDGMKTGQDLATLESLKNSKNIKIPLTPARDKNIHYLIDLLYKTYPDIVRTLISFGFEIDPSTKKLNIDEKIEYTVLMKNEDVNRLQAERDRKSVESLLALLRRFRLFNLTKLVKKAKTRNLLSKLIKSELGINIFTFKHYELDKNNLEEVDDYCFHSLNYESVKESMNTDAIKKIVQGNTAQIMRRLKKFGILNTEFSDYRDSKLDYILHILNNDIPTYLAPKDLIEVKNFTSLRSCLIKVEKIIDPLVSMGGDIANYIRECGVCDQSSLMAVFDNVSEEMISRWSAEGMDKYRIISFKNQIGGLSFIDVKYFVDRMRDIRALIMKGDEFDAITPAEKQKKISDIDFYCSIGSGVLISDERAKTLLGDRGSADEIKKTIQECMDFKKRLEQESQIKERLSRKEKKSLFKMISDFFSGLFGGGSQQETGRRIVSYQAQAPKTELSKRTKTIYEKMKSGDDRIIPLSNYIDLTPENAHHIDTVISDLRSHGLKIVVPVYNARRNLYPNRSQKYLISDIEYLLISPEAGQTPESIREYTDSLAGFKIKDETMPGQAILAVEKYLLTLYRQKKAQMIRERQKESKKSSVS